MTGHCQHCRFGLIQAIDARRPVTSTVFKVLAEDALEKGRRHLIVLFISLVSLNRDRALLHPIDKIFNGLPLPTIFLVIFFPQAFSIKLANAESNQLVRQQRVIGHIYQ